ncbi:MAG: S8 family serine peptidase [Pirellulales bacterium]|nr:S8 family serine peptidase [Pirellulales bacterium]
MWELTPMHYSFKRQDLSRRLEFERCEQRMLMSVSPSIPPDFKLSDLFVEDISDSTIPQGTSFGGGTSYGNTGAHTLTGWNTVQNAFGLSGTGQTVVVIDSGIAYNQVSLGGGFGSNYRVVGGWDFVENDADPFDDGPAGFHGTHVAGIIGSSSTTYPGVAPNVDLVALRVFNDQGTMFSTAIQNALTWVHNNRNSFANPITAINLSLGFDYNSGTPPYWAMLEDQLNQLEADGIFISVAAGNYFASYNAPGLSYPAASSYVVPVMSVNSSGVLSGTSQRHSRAIAAPGVSITSTVPDHRGNNNGIHDDFGTYSGTSMAAPYIAGSSVLLRQALEIAGQTNITQDMIYDVMMNTAVTFFDSATNANYKRLDLYNAINTVLAGDDFGSTAGTAHAVGTLTDGHVFNGAISRISDLDYFTFTASSSGTLDLSAVEKQDLSLTWEVTVGGNTTTYTGNNISLALTAGQTYTLALGTNDGAGRYLVTADISTSSTGAHTPSVTNASTLEDTLSAAGLVITRSAQDGAEVTHFQITNITNGTLYLNDGVTVVANNSFVTAAQGTAGLKFRPNSNFVGTGSFQVQAALGSTVGQLGGSLVTAQITVSAVADTPSVTNATTTEDITTSSGLVITRSAADGAEVTHFQITNITNGTLYLNDGVTVVANNSFVTAAQGTAGLKFRPNSNFVGTGSFQVTSALGASVGQLGGSLVTAQITVSAVADTPSVTNASTTEDVTTTSGLVITRSAADGTEVTHFQLTNITNGTLYLNDGVTVVANNSFVTAAQGTAGLKFRPNANFVGTGSFQVQASLGASVGQLGGSTVTAQITVSAVADTPSVTNTSTLEDTLSSSGLVITRSSADGAEVTHFQITNITNGTLYLNDGVTVVANNSFVTAAQGTAGLKFRGNANFVGTGSFQVQASLGASVGQLGGSPVTAQITVSAVADTPSVTNASTTEDVTTTSGLVITRSAADGAEVTHFQITNITNGTLYLNDGVTVVANNSFVTAAQGTAGLKFRPNANFVGTGSFQVQAALGASVGQLGGSLVTAQITVNAVADTPSVTNTSTLEDTLSSSGLVITRSAADGAEVTHFQITSITNGTLYLNDGVTVVANNSFVTVAQGTAGLKFRPNSNFVGTGSFQVQAALGASVGQLGGSLVTAQITVSAVADTPSVTNTSTLEDTLSSSGLVITRSAADGAEVTHFQITNITNGTLYLNDGVTVVANNSFVTAAQGTAGLKFRPNANFVGTGSFQVQAALGASVGQLGGSPVTAQITVSAVADTPSVTNASTTEDVTTTSGLVITRSSADGAEVTHFQITNITNGTLYLNDGVTVVANNSFVTAAQGTAGLKFRPNSNFVGTGSFQVQASLGASVGQLGGSLATAQITVSAVADTPSVTNATTTEDVTTTSGLVITRSAADGAEVTHFQITNITNGTLYLNDGVTVVANNSFVTAAQGTAGLKFRPNSNFVGTGSFQVQAALGASVGQLGGTTVTASITVTAAAGAGSNQANAIDWGTVAGQTYAGISFNGELWYALTASRTGILTSELLTSQGSANAALSIFNQPNQLLASLNFTANSRVDLQVQAGQRYFFKFSGSASNLSHKLTNLITQTGQTVTVGGTSDADNVVYQAGAFHAVLVNGTLYTYALSQANTFNLDGGGGHDLLTLMGTSGNDTGTLGPTSSSLRGAGFTANATGFEQTSINGNGGSDTVDMHDSAGNDSFFANPWYAMMSGAGYVNIANGFGNVRAYASSGTDGANLHDSAGNDQLTANPTTITLSGTGFSLTAAGFDYTQTYSYYGGNDTALLIDSSGSDLFSSLPNFSVLMGSGFYNLADGFRNVTADGRNGGYDVNYMFDSAGNDLFSLSQTGAVMQGSNFYNYAKNFDFSVIYSSYGNDTATLYDSPFDDNFEVDGEWGRFSGFGYYGWLNKFETINLNGTAGGYNTITRRAAAQFVFNEIGSWY